MIYPSFLREEDMIALIAPSDGVSNPIKQNRLKSAIKIMEQKGYLIEESHYMYQSNLGRSASAEQRALEIQQAFMKPQVKLLWCVAGGDFLLECLPYLDFERISKNPKWVQGYSDPTGLLFLITTHTDIATIYGYNFGTVGRLPWHETVETNLALLEGRSFTQQSQTLYEKEGGIEVTGTEPFSFTESVNWQILTPESHLVLYGRLLGGCLDVLLSLVGTKYDVTSSFVKKYTEGWIWYFDCCELSSEQIIRGLWQLKEAGWFWNVKGFVFGRPMVETSCYDISFSEAILESLGKLHVPIVIGADLGHVPPVCTWINGALAEIKVNNGKANIKMLFE